MISKHKEPRRSTQSDSVSTVYRIGDEYHDRQRDSIFDPGYFPVSFGVSAVTHCPPGFEHLYDLDKVYFIKRVEMVKNDTFDIYKGEIITESNDRIFLVSNCPRFEYEDLQPYRHYNGVKINTKICYGVTNYAGVKVFEIYGEPEKALRIGSSPTVWGELQIIPMNCWHNLINVCGKSVGEIEILVLVLKRENNIEDFKKVYILRGQVEGGWYRRSRNRMFKKDFDLQIYKKDILGNNDSKHRFNNDHTEEVVGRICSSGLHDKLQCKLPFMELPTAMSIYDKIILMGIFFLFDGK